MTFRSPPPHRRMSRQTRGKSQFEQDQLDLQRMVQKVGFDDLPINDESLRPFLKQLWDTGQRHGYKVFTFDIPQQWPDRFFHGLLGSAVQLKKVADEIQFDLLKVYTPEQIARAVPVFKVAKMSVCYFEGVWTPKAALASRRH